MTIKEKIGFAMICLPLVIVVVVAFAFITKISPMAGLLSVGGIVWFFTALYFLAS